MVKDEIPFIRLDEKHYQKREIITELNEVTQQIIKDCLNKHKGEKNTERTIQFIQAEIDNMCGGKRLFEVRNHYDKYKKKAKLWGSDEVVEIEDKILDPYSLDVVWVG